MRPAKILTSVPMLLTALVMTLSPATSAHAQRDGLKIGDPAPGLDIEEWINGVEITLAPGTAYIVTFFSTAEAASWPALPYLSELQNEHIDAGMFVVGVTSEESDVVKPWVSNQSGSKMAFVVALDRRGSTDRAWMQASGRESRPTAFIVDRQGRVAFIGDPSPKADGPEMARVLDKVLRNRFDPKLEAQAKPVLASARRARKVGTWRMALKAYDEVIELSHSLFADVALERFEMLLVDMKNKEQAYKYARDTLVGGQFSGDDEALRMLAEKIATDPKIKREDRDLDLALVAAEASMAIAGRGSPEAHASLALIRYHRGEVREAVRHQKRAWMIAKPKKKPELLRVLRSYQDAVSRTG